MQDIRDMLSGHTKGSMNITTKWDGAPAVFAGVDPEDGKFFVAKKGLFNKNPQMFKTPADLKAARLNPELESKLGIALREFSKLKIKTGVYQGDMMFTTGDLASEKIEGVDYITFQPNTIIYAIPKNTLLARQIKQAKIGIVWHTTYTGKTISEMRASFGKSIMNKMGKSRSVWMDDATYKDVSGTATFNVKETKILNNILSKVGGIFQKLPKAALDDISKNDEFLIRVKAFNNSKIREGKSITNPRKHVMELKKYIVAYYKKEADKRKGDKGKQVQLDKSTEFMKYFDSHGTDMIKIYDMVILLVHVKDMIVRKLNSVGSLSTFLRTRNGFKVTNQEGYVIVDHLKGGAVKIVDRLEFSMANFSPEILKGWEK